GRAFGDPGGHGRAHHAFAFRRGPHHLRPWRARGRQVGPRQEAGTVFDDGCARSLMPKAFTKAEVEEFFARLKTQNPSPKTELEYVNPYTLLVAVALSAQATDKGVNKATKELFKKVRTPQQMLALGEAGLIQHIKTIGLYKGKAKNVIAAAKLLVEKHRGEVPNDQAALEELPGVGRKTANVVRNVAFGEKTIAVD